MSNHTNVKLERRPLKNGKISLRLVFSPRYYNIRTRKTVRTENLNLYLIAEPKNAAERKYNQEIEDLANAIKGKRIVQIRNEEFGFLDKSLKEGDFLEYFRIEAARRHTKWEACYKQFVEFCGGHCKFRNLSVVMCKHFRDFLLNEAVNHSTGQRIKRNTAAGYLITFRSILKQAYVDKILDKNLNDFFEDIKTEKTDKEYLTMEEFRRLVNTPCKIDVLRRISIFAVFSALRLSDLETLDWSQIIKAPDGGWCIHKNIVKSRRLETVFISDEALAWCGPREEGLVFKGFKRTMVQKPLKQWLKDAGIDKPFTFHCFRHTAATLMLSRGADIYSVSTALTHSNVQTTQIYADLVNEKKRSTANAISLINN